MRDRNLCKFYIAAHQCSKGKNAEINTTCQHCGLWEDSKRSAKENTKRHRLEREERKDWRND